MSKFRKESIEQGHAEYIINKDNEKEFKWFPSCKYWHKTKFNIVQKD